MRQGQRGRILPSWKCPASAVRSVAMRTPKELLRSLVGAVRRVNSVSTPVGGVGWTPAPSEREEVRRLIVFLEDRRALFDPYNVEATMLVGHSVQEIRGELTRVLQTLGEASRANEPLRTMRAGCQQYLTRAAAFPDEPYWHRPLRFGRDFSGDDVGGDFVMALGELRGVCGVCLGQLAESYGLTVQGPLAAVLPDESDESAV